MDEDTEILIEKGNITKPVLLRVIKQAKKEVFDDIESITFSKDVFWWCMEKTNYNHIKKKHLPTSQQSVIGGRNEDKKTY